MSMEYIRNTYNVPVKKGGKVLYTPYGVMGPHHLGVIVGTHGSRVKVKMNNYEKAKYFHPTWAMRYL